MPSTVLVARVTMVEKKKKTVLGFVEFSDEDSSNNAVYFVGIFFLPLLCWVRTIIYFIVLDTLLA